MKPYRAVSLSFPKVEICKKAKQVSWSRIVVDSLRRRSMEQENVGYVDGWDIYKGSLRIIEIRPRVD